MKRAAATISSGGGTKVTVGTAGADGRLADAAGATPWGGGEMSAPLFSWFLAFAVHGVEGALCLVVIRMRGVLGSLPRERFFPLMILGIALPWAGVP